MINIEILSEALRVPIILQQRILERKRLTVERLSPFLLIFRTEYPPRDVFGFYDEQSEWRNKQVINLCSSVGGGNDHIMESLIYLRIQRKPQP